MHCIHEVIFNQTTFCTHTVRWRSAKPPTVNCIQIFSQTPLGSNFQTTYCTPTEKQFPIKPHSVPPLRSNFQSNHILYPHWEVISNQTTYRVHIELKEVPVGFDDFKHHVVLKVLHKVEHALPQCEGSRVPARLLHAVHLGHFVPHPHAAHTHIASCPHSVHMEITCS